MNGKRHTPEQIIRKLRQAEVGLGQGATVPQVATERLRQWSCPDSAPHTRRNPQQ